MNFATSLVGMGAIHLAKTEGLVTNAGGKVTPDFELKVSLSASVSASGG